MAVVTMKQLLEAGVHFGHQTRRWNPKMKRFIFGERNGIYIIDLNQTLERIETAYTLRARPGRRRRHDPLRRHQEADPGPDRSASADKCGMPYVNERWLGGMLTNFQTISARVKKMQEYERRQQLGDFEAMPKKEALILSRELEKLQRNLGGIRYHRASCPTRCSSSTRRRSTSPSPRPTSSGMPIVAVVDTNCDPDVIQYVIPGNDDAIRAGTLMCRVIADAVEEGRFIASAASAACSATAGGRRAAPTPRRPVAEQQAAAAAAGRGPAPRPPAGPGALGGPSGRRPSSRRRGAARRAPATSPQRLRRRAPTLRASPAEATEAAGARRRDRRARHRRATHRGRPMAEIHRQGRRSACARLTGAGMMDGKRALEENDGDFEAAKTWLREKGLARRAKRADREKPSRARSPWPSTGNGGAVGRAQAARPTSWPRAPEFTGLVTDAGRAGGGQGRGRPGRRALRATPSTDLARSTLKENIALGRVVRFEADGGAGSTPTCTSRASGASIGVLVELTGDPATRSGPRPTRSRCTSRFGQARVRVSRDDVPAEVVEPSSEVLENLTRNEGKPEAGHPQDRRGPAQRLLQGRVPARAALRADPQADASLQLLGPEAKVTRFARVEIGERIAL